MTKARVNFRFSDEAIVQLMELEKLELEQKNKYGLKPKSKTEIIEEALKEYYVSRLQGKSGHTFFDHIETRLNGIFMQHFKNLVESINVNQLQNIKNTELILLFFKLLKVDYDKTKVDTALQLDSYIESKVDEKIKKIVSK